MPLIRLPLALTALLTAPAFAAGGGAVEVLVENVRTEKGVVLVQICDRANFLRKCTLGGSAPAKPGTVAVIIRNVPPGDYAAMAFHDTNHDGQLNRWLGVPKEDIGFSGLHGLPLRPPRFKDSVFAHGPSDQKLTVKLGNYFG